MNRYEIILFEEDKEPIHKKSNWLEFNMYLDDWVKLIKVADVEYRIIAKRSFNAVTAFSGCSCYLIMDIKKVKSGKE